MIVALYGTSLVAAAVLALRFLHMLQLSSYQWPSYKKWMKEHGGETLLPAAIPLVLAALASLWKTGGLYVACFSLAVAALLMLPRHKAKKKLVMTSRAWRIYLLWLLLLAAVNATMFAIDEQRTQIAQAALLLLLTPYGLALSNWLLTPVQKAINNGYVRSAKKLLAAKPDMTIIGVTGSFGKTSVKYMLHAFLNTTYNTLMTPESYNTPMGVVKTIRGQLSPAHEMFICEMGARHVGDIQEICDIVHPKHGVVTAIGPAHLETFGNMDNIANTKFELLRALPADGFSFVNADDETIAAQDMTGLTVVRYGFGDADYRASELAVDRGGSSFVLTLPDGTTQAMRTPLIGRHNVLNIVGAMAVAHKLGVAVGQLARAALTLKAVPHRLELKQQGEFTIIDDAFNANPTGAKAALDTLALVDGYKILVTPGMVELGEREEELNKAFGVQAAAVCDCVILVGEQQTKPIAEGLAEAGYEPTKLIVVKTIQEAFARLRALDSGGQPKVALLENDLPDNY